MIVYFSDGGKDYWYDGTNRSGIPGITSDDLLNAPALILDSVRSRIQTIAEYPRNLLAIDGQLTSDGTSLQGNLVFRLQHQYAMPFLYLQNYGNTVTIHEACVRWLERSVSSRLRPSKVSWGSTDSSFLLVVSCELPNALTSIDSAVYLSFSRVFPELVPEVPPPGQESEIFYNPYYSRIRIAVHLRDVFRAEKNPGAGSDWAITVSLPSGPFEKDTATQFLLDHIDLRRRWIHLDTFYRTDS